MQLSRTPRGRSTSNRRKKKHPSFHIVLIGDTGVGKTSLLTQYSDNTYRDHHITTIGLDFKIAKTTVDEKQYNLMIWDTAGQERFKTITPSFYRKASGMVRTNEWSSNHNTFDHTGRPVPTIENINTLHFF